MNLQSLPAWVYPVILLVLVILAGIGEYLHLLPAGTFNSIILVVVGLIVPSPPYNNTKALPATKEG